MREDGAVSRFELVVPPVLSSAPIARDALSRLDPARRKESWSTARVVVVDGKGRFPVVWTADPSSAEPDDTGAGAAGRPRLWTRAATAVADSSPSEALLLGEADGVAYWGMRAPTLDADGDGDGPPEWMDLFTIGAELTAVEAALSAAAVALLNWHDRARFCARDGSPTRVTNAGWARVCEAENHEEYPRTDPAVICLVHDGADRLLLARQRVWPAGRFSVLAGFVEAGESLEACVAREVAEEVGIDVREIGYLGSQTWPFPRSLMIGFQAVADPGAPFRLDGDEIAEAMWVSLDDLSPALARTDWGAPGEADDGQIRLPGRLSIARAMIDSWVMTR
jgi:NAD+ diphosphatase